MATSKIKSDSIDTIAATKLTGTVDNARITLDAAEIPNLDAAKITTGSIADARVPASAVTQHAPNEITKSSSEPTATTNPSSGVGTVWLRTTTGEMYCCTDATTNANVWINIGDGTGRLPVQNYMTATNTNGTETTDGNYKVVTFNTSGTFIPTIGSAGFGDFVEYLVVAGGGGGGQHAGGSGGGAGGYLTASATVLSQSYTITIGAGGIGGTTSNTSSAGNGTDSLGVGITATGGGRGQLGGTGGNGGSGGGGNAGVGTGISGQGFAGGLGGPSQLGGGGGGASAVGAPAVASTKAGDGGAGKTSSITGTSIDYAGGGAGGSHTNFPSGTGGLGGGGAGGQYSSSSPALNGVAGTINRGGGGGGAGGQTGIIAAAGGAGGSGVVIIRYQFQ
jgi:hypothetical protein